MGVRNLSLGEGAFGKAVQSIQVARRSWGVGRGLGEPTPGNPVRREVGADGPGIWGPLPAAGCWLGDGA